MALSWSLLVFLLLAAGIVWFWQDSLAARERANQAAVDACNRLSLQFLDGTVAFARLWPVRGVHGRLTLRRTYVFDYTADSIARHQGFVVLVGSRVESIGFAGESPLRAEDVSASPEPKRNTAEPPPVIGNVYDLDSWRRREHAQADETQRRDDGTP